MQKTLVTFSLTLILNVRVSDIPKPLRNTKRYLISQNFGRTQWDKKNKNYHENGLINYIFTGLEREKKKEKKDKVKVPQRNEMLSLYCTGLGLISKNEECNLEKNIPDSSYLKNLTLQ